MEHPVQYLARVTHFLNEVIQEHGDYLFVGFGFVCLGVIAWIFTRQRKHPVHDISVIVLPLGQTPRRDSEPEPPPFVERCDL